jgi:glutamyl-tRNA synthetase
MLDCDWSSDVCSSDLELADEATPFYSEVHPAQELLNTHLTPDVLPALRELVAAFNDIAWEPAAIAATIKAMLTQYNLKMSKLAMPLRVMLVGQTHTPSVDGLLATFPKSVVIGRVQHHL